LTEKKSRPVVDWGRKGALSVAKGERKAKEEEEKGGERRSSNTAERGGNLIHWRKGRKPKSSVCPTKGGEKGRRLREGGKKKKKKKKKKGGGGGGGRLCEVM